jgi:hypothetical protein
MDDGGERNKTHPNHECSANLQILLWPQRFQFEAVLDA